MDVITLKQGERQELNQWVRGQSRDAAQARRARLILLLADGERYGLIRDKLDCDTNFIARWKSRFVGQGLAGLYSRHCGKAPSPGSERQAARILKWTTQRKPADGSTHWSSRKLSLELGDVSHTTIARVWAKHGIKPHRLERYMASNDADFESKAADIIGLYLNPPQHAAIFSVDEKTAIQALDRIQSCRSRLDEPNDTVLNTFATARSRFMLPSTPAPERSWGKRLGATLAPSLSPS